MAEINREFGDLLTQALKSIAALENKPLGILEEELAAELGRSIWAVEKWRQGMLPSESAIIRGLARAGVKRGRLSQKWLERFLHQAQYENKPALIQELFPLENEKSASRTGNNIPRRTYEQFIGREEHLAQARAWLSYYHRSGVVSITGMAGI